MPRSIETIAAEANRLYWETETSVADIAAQLELSRRALYTAVEPLPTSRSCTACGAPLVYENRSARASDFATCPNGDPVDELPNDGEHGATYATAPASDAAGATASRSQRDTAARARDSLAPARGTAWTWSRGSAESAADAATRTQRAAVIGAAVAGAALGALVTLFLVPRR